FVDLKKRFRDEIVALSLNTDYGYEVEEKEGSPDALKEKVLQFVTKHGANFQHGISNLPEEVLYFDEDKLNTKAPATLVYDKSGKLRETFPKKVEGEEGKYEPYSFHDDVIPLVKTLVAEKYEPSKSVTNEENADANKSSTSNESKDIEGCVEPPIEKTKNSGDGDSAQSDKVSVEIDNWEGLQERVKKAKGKVVVVDLWSTQCVPCLKEYPHLVKLHNERKAEVACLSFNLDFYGVGTPEELKPDVLAVLKKLNSTLPNFMSKLEDEKVYEQLKLASIPAVYVYDRNGKLQKRFDDTQGQFTYEKDILPLVETLIKEKK
ncbi:MAG: TlpA family protein disulfide reductase, partial [Planctomycetaceae bacterium]|nr:TlpA family protein disulfide reductase [Planctomycetaceae bacterium]